MLNAVVGDPGSVSEIDEFGQEGFDIQSYLGQAIAEMIALAFCPLGLVSLFQTSHFHSETLLGELQNRGFASFKTGGEASTYVNMSYDGIKDGKHFNPVQYYVGRLFNETMGDMPDPDARNALHDYTDLLALGWSTAPQPPFASQAAHFHTNEGNQKAVYWLSQPHEKTATFANWVGFADVKKADRIFVYRVVDIHASLFSTSGTMNDYLRTMPADIDERDLVGLHNFFLVMALKSFATGLGLCGTINCAYPPIAPAP
jgi:hypothetical protein